MTGITGWMLLAKSLVNRPADLSGVCLRRQRAFTITEVGPMLDLSGAGVINSIVQPVFDQWFGLSTLSTAIFENGTSFIGTFYAPDTFVSMVGNTQIYGAVVCASNTIGNSAGIHFDESLKTSNGGAGNYSIAAWQGLRKISGVYQ